MGKLRVAKKFRGHYAKAKNSTSVDSATVNDLEGIVLRGQTPSTGTSSDISRKQPTTPEPIPEEFRGQDVVLLPTKPNKTKQVQSKKERRTEKHEKWIKSSRCGVLYIRVISPFVRVGQLSTGRQKSY